MPNEDDLQAFFDAMAGPQDNAPSVDQPSPDLSTPWESPGGGYGRADLVPPEFASPAPSWGFDSGSSFGGPDPAQRWADLSSPGGGPTFGSNRVPLGSMLDTTLNRMADLSRAPRQEYRNAWLDTVRQDENLVPRPQMGGETEWRNAPVVKQGDSWVTSVYDANDPQNNRAEYVWNGKGWDLTNRVKPEPKSDKPRSTGTQAPRTPPGDAGETEAQKATRLDSERRRAGEVAGGRRLSDSEIGGGYQSGTTTPEEWARINAADRSRVVLPPRVWTETRPAVQPPAYVPEGVVLGPQMWSPGPSDLRDHGYVPPWITGPPIPPPGVNPWTRNPAPWEQWPAAYERAARGHQSFVDRNLR